MANPLHAALSEVRRNCSIAARRPQTKKLCFDPVWNIAWSIFSPPHCCAIVTALWRNPACRQASTAIGRVIILVVVVDADKLRLPRVR